MVQSRATRERARFISQTGVRVSFEQQTKCIVLPLRRIERLPAIVIVYGLLVLAQVPVDLAARQKCHAITFKFDDFV
jgi:hypothetical protein